MGTVRLPTVTVAGQVDELVPRHAIEARLPPPNTPNSDPEPLNTVVPSSVRAVLKTNPKAAPKASLQSRLSLPRLVLPLAPWDRPQHLGTTSKDWEISTDPDSLPLVYE
jgi:hypothetical protein